MRCCVREVHCLNHVLCSIAKAGKGEDERGLAIAHLIGQSRGSERYGEISSMQISSSNFLSP